jgi:EAL domain-containing protein (putative c-di-GMP-specific phosphodiesterase class I)
MPAVETASALSSLWQAGVNYIQGHYLQSPSAAMNYDFAAGEE